LQTLVLATCKTATHLISSLLTVVDSTLSTPKKTGFSESVSTPIRVAPVSFDRLEVVVHKGGEQYTSSQATSHYDSYVVPDELSGDKPQVLSIEDGVKSDVEK